MNPATPRFQKPPVPPPARVTTPRPRPVAATSAPEAGGLSPVFVVLLVIFGGLLLILAFRSVPGFPLLILAIMLGFIPASIAQRKGRLLPVWWLYGAALFLVALIHALIMKPTARVVESRQAAEGMKKCPYCAEMIKPDATVCRYCGRDVQAAPTG